MKPKITLTENQWKKISEITSNIGLIAIGSVVIPSLFDKLNIASAITGLSLATGFIYASIIVARKY